MIYLIGGTPRVGKSLLLQKFIEQKPMPGLSCDFLYDLKQISNISEFGDADILEKGQLFYPTLKELLFNTSLRSENAIIEGEVILPSQVVELAKQYDVKACFLGLSSTGLEQVIAFGGYFNWPQYKQDHSLSHEVRDLAERCCSQALP